MTTLNRLKTLELLDALSVKDLKAKHVGAENFMKVIGLVRTIKKAVAELIEQEKIAAEQMGYTGPDSPEKIKEFNAKIKPLQDAFSVEVELNFIPEGELKEYVKEQDTAVAATLFEYLLRA